MTSQLRTAADLSQQPLWKDSEKRGPKDYLGLLNIAEGSLGETEYLVRLSRDLHHVPSDSANTILVEIKELASRLHSLRRIIQNDAL